MEGGNFQRKSYRLKKNIGQKEMFKDTYFICKYEIIIKVFDKYVR